MFLSLPLWFFDLFSSEARATVPPAPQLRKSATAIPGRRSMARSSRRGTVATASFRYADASSNALPKPSGLAPIIPDAVQVASPTSVGPMSPKRSVSPHSPQRSPKRGLSRSPSRRGGHASASAKHLYTRTPAADAAAPPPTVSARQIFTCLSLFCGTCTSTRAWVAVAVAVAVAVRVCGCMWAWVCVCVGADRRIACFVRRATGGTIAVVLFCLRC